MWLIIGSLAIGLFGFWYIYFRRSPRIYKPKGDVFVTGADSGMGEEIVNHLSSLGYNLFAGCYLPASEERWKNVKGVTFVPLDVSNLQSVKAAAELVEKKLSKDGLVGVFNCAGIALMGPAEYLPIALYERSMNTNFFGYINVTQALLPLLRKQSKEGRAGRIAFVSSGPLPGPSPPMLSPYIASKWAGLRIEMAARELNIDAVMISPTFVRPTNIAAFTLNYLEQLWKRPDLPAQESDEIAQEEYGPVMDAVVHDISNPHSTAHVSVLGTIAEEILAVKKPNLRYYTLWDGRASLFLGVVPTVFREWLLRNTMLKTYKGPGK